MKEILSDALLSGITSEAEKEAEQLLAEASTSKTQKLASAEMLKARLLAESKEKGEKQAVLIHKAAESAIAVEKRRLALKREDRLYSLIVKAVRQRFREFPDSPDYKDALIGWIAEGAIGLGCDTIHIHASPKVYPVLHPDLFKKVEKIVSNTIGKKILLTGVRDDLIDDCGVILKDQTGRLVYDNRMEARLRRYNQHILGIIARELLQE